MSGYASFFSWIYGGGGDQTGANNASASLQPGAARCAPLGVDPKNFPLSLVVVTQEQLAAVRLRPTQTRPPLTKFEPISAHIAQLHEFFRTKGTAARAERGEDADSEGRIVEPNVPPADVPAQLQQPSAGADGRSTEADGAESTFAREPEPSAVPPAVALLSEMIVLDG